MAKGNDGNYLQHSVELAVAANLVALDPQRRLHIMLTHGMAPYEPFGPIPNGQKRENLLNALLLANEPPKPREHRLVTAYRTTNASSEHYPNSGELIATIIDRNRLSGWITEVDAAKYIQLQEVWRNSHVEAMQGSWRHEMGDSGVKKFPLPRRENIPWLLSMDPMTYVESGHADDNRLYSEDQACISQTLRDFVASKVPGAATLFVYAVHPEVRDHFWAFAKGIAADTGMSFDSCWLTHQGGNRNLAAVLCSEVTLAPDWLPPNLNPGR